MHDTPDVEQRPRRTKPSKPRPDFPLYAHAAGYWAKRIRGKIHYFGAWADPDAALAKYLDQKDDLYAGRQPRSDPEGVTVKDLANAFLNHKQARLESKELAPRTFADYHAMADLVVKHFGKTRSALNLGPDDFTKLRNALAKKWGPVRLGREIQRIRSLFLHAYDQGLIDKPIRYGKAFKGPSKRTERLHKAKQGPNLFTLEEIHILLNAARPSLRAMILLGINCGFGNADVGNLPLAALDLERGWVDYPRPKTGVARRCPLWPETIAALRDALATRPEPRPEYAGLVFITRYGASYAKDSCDNPVSYETRSLLRRKCKINRQRRLGFYTLRHTFRTVADESRDQPAVDHIMGHESPHMSSVYRERISDERLQAVTDYVRTWLYGK
jgi:integrase